MSNSSPTPINTFRRQWKYDVFLNFSGRDVRDKFLSHLRAALGRAKLVVFFDEDLRRGKEISPALLKAIEESHVAVTIFSTNYASSPWCLEELVKIIECYQYRGQIVIPVFYDVSSSVVLEQSGIYAEAFAKHERDRENSRNVPKWKAAMTKAANLSGRSARNTRPESNLVNEIVNDILISLERTSDGMVETGSGVQKSWSVKFSHIHTIEVHGMGGLMMYKSEELPVENLVSLLEPLQKHLSEASLQSLTAESSYRRTSPLRLLENREESKSAVTGRSASSSTHISSYTKTDPFRVPSRELQLPKFHTTSASDERPWWQEEYIEESKNVMPAGSSSAGKNSFFLSSAEDKIVLYFTTLEANKKTYKDCDEVRMIFRGLQVAVDERNTYIDPLYRKQLRDALGTTVSLPQVFIRGKHIGGVEEIRKLNETGKLKQLAQGFPVKNRAAFCEACGNITFVACPNCGPGRMCSDCNHVGLIRCRDCC